MSALFLLLAIVAWAAGIIVLLVQDVPNGNYLWGALLIGLIFFALSMVVWEGILARPRPRIG